MRGRATRGHAESGPQHEARVFDTRLLKRLWPFLKPHQRWIWFGLALQLLQSACRLLMPWLMRLALDEHLVPMDAEGNYTAPALDGMWRIGAAFGAVALAEWWMQRRQIMAMETAGQSSLHDLRIAVFGHLQRLSSRFYDRTPIGRLLGRVTTDVEALQEMFSSGVITIMNDVVFLVSVAVLLLFVNWQLALVTFISVPVLLVVTVFIRGRVRGGYRDLRAALSRMNAFLHEHVTGMPLVQMFTLERAVGARFAEVNDQVRESQLSTVRWESALSASTEMLGSFTTAGILWFGGGILTGAWGGATPGLTFGELFLFIDLMGRFFAPLTDLSQKYTVMQNAMTASERIFALLDEDDVTEDPASPATAPLAKGAIEFRDVHFEYDAGEPVLKGISFGVAPGERVAIVGATGSGKTTLLKLLTRLYDIQSGAILLDGLPIEDYGLKVLRSRVGVVPQDVFLFEGDLLENIRLGHPEISESQAIAAAERLHLGEVVSRFPAGYREVVRERGKNLSSGERQLIAFARAMATAPPILALDEATSNVDSHTEHLLQEAVHELMRGRTSLIIAHRLSTIRDVDRILVLHKGELVEEGSHQELLAREGVYWRLYQLQYEEQESEALNAAPDESRRDT